MSAMYVVTTERDTYEPQADSRPICFEQYLDNGAADLDEVRDRAERTNGRYGKVRIARLVFEGEPGFEA